MSTHTPDASVISWDIFERKLTDGSATFDVVGTSDECRVTLYCVDERAVETLCDLLNSTLISGAAAEKVRNGVAPAEKTCTRCNEGWPADTEFFRPQPKPRQPNRLAPWCRACEAEQKTQARAIARATLVKAGSTS